MIPCQELKAKRLKQSQKLLRKQCISKQSTKSYEYKISKSSSPSVSWKLHTSLTQKDTMDRGAWIKNPERKAWGGLERTKSPKAQQRWKMAWEWGTNEYFCLPCVTMLWCLSWKPPKDRGKMNFIYLASKELSWLWDSKFGFHSLKLDYHQWLQVQIFDIMGI